MIRTLSAVLLLAGATAASAAQPISGRWLTTDGGAVVAIGPCGATLCGRIARILKPNPRGITTDVLNPNPKLRNRAFIGMPILTGLTPDGDGWKGQIYDPKSGKTYRAVVGREGGRLKVQGCISLFCRTMLWTAAG